MICYFIARIYIKDEEEYQKYLDGADAVFSKFGGRYLAVDDGPVFLEGNAESGRIVLIEFPDERELRRWYDSPEYQGILKHRLKAADCSAALVHGLPGK
jgi:uncharacterized protein (DUF1330 family)